MKKIYVSLCALMAAAGFTACAGDPLSEQSVFDELSSYNGISIATQPTKFDKWLIKNYVEPYNVDFQYKFSDIESDKKYTLVPADSAKSAKLAIIIKHLWFDAYDEVIGADFLKESAPRIITLIGSPAYNSEGTMVLGTAEGGYRVTLYMVNRLTPEVLADYETLTTYYFTTMHHEFTHILNQKKPYDASFDLISMSDYVSGDWYQWEMSEAKMIEALRKGFVRGYAMAEGREDFAETASQYITNPDDVWAEKLRVAGSDGAEGATIINQKLEMIRKYFRDSWGLDIDELHRAVIRRGQDLGSLDLEHLK